ncbi:pseudouridine synthase deg1 [Elasticomyces elasticus]|nr:pseudouridine synthase deg1 [Elasticomyces elasticus]
MATSKQPDYTTYSHADLLRRVTELEAQLRRYNRAAQGISEEPEKYRKKPKKPNVPFDPSRYNTRLIALKFAYLGGNYNGLEHHTNNTTPLPTVEEELWKALRKTRLILPDFGGKPENEICWDGCEYSKCGRTDRGVSAFGQVIGIKVRSCKPKEKDPIVNGANSAQSAGIQEVVMTADETSADDESVAAPTWDPIRDELSYIQLLNRVLPTDIRVLAWCPDPPPDFSARFNCKERRYRYFFTNPAYAAVPGSEVGRLNIEKMQAAAKKLEGLHDFRNLCKIDASKQITNFERRIFHAGIHQYKRDHVKDSPELYYFEVRGSAFLWHQVRDMVAIMFLVGQGYEQPEIVDHLLDIEKCPGKPSYDMADDRPLVLWDCIFPDAAQLSERDHDSSNVEGTPVGYTDAIDWIYVGNEGGRDPSKRVLSGVDDGKYGSNGIMDSLWSLWRQRKMDEVLAGSLMEMVALMGGNQPAAAVSLHNGELIGSVDQVKPERSDRVFDGSERPRTVGRYVPLSQRKMVDAPELVNARYASRRGMALRPKNAEADADADE